MSFDRRDLLVCAGLVLLTGAVYSQVLNHGFVGWDDNAYVYENPNVRDGLTASGISWAFTSSHSSNWHPLTWMSHMVDVELAGVEPGVWLHHGTSLLFHLFNTVLLFVTLRIATAPEAKLASHQQMSPGKQKAGRKAKRTKGKPDLPKAAERVESGYQADLSGTATFWAAAWVAAMFALHPLHVESVAWISERKDVLSTFFGLLTIVAYVLYSRRPFSWMRYLPVPVLLALGLMSKPMLVTWPVLLLLLDFWPLGRLASARQQLGQGGWLRSRVVLEKIPLVVLVFISATVTFLIQQQGGSVRSWGEMSLGYRIANSSLAYVMYLWQTLWPVDLAFFYPIDVHQRPMLGLQVIGAVLVLAAITFLAVWQRQRRPYLLTGWLWFVVSLLPVIGLVQVGGQMRADRYMYIPQIGLLVMVGWTCAQFAINASRRQAVAALAIVSVVMACGLTWRQVGTWKSNATLASQALAVTVNNAVANYLMGASLQKAGESEEAIPYLREAVRLNPLDVFAAHDLAVILFQKKELDEAALHFGYTIENNPSFAQGYSGLSAVEESRGNNAQALEYAQRAVELEPENFGFQMNLATMFEKLQQWEQAAQRYEVAVTKPSLSESANRDRALGYLRLAMMRIRLGELDAAESALNQAAKLDPANATIHSQLGSLALERGKPRKAVAHCRKALQVDRQQLEAINTLAWLMATQRDSAIRNGEQAVSLIEPVCQQLEAPPAALLDTLAATYAAAGRYEEAVATAQRAMSEAEKSGDAALVEEIRDRLNRYRRGEAIYEG